MLESCCSAHGFPSLLWLDFKRETVYSTQIILTAPVSYYKIIFHLDLMYIYGQRVKMLLFCSKVPQLHEMCIEYRLYQPQVQKKVDTEYNVSKTEWSLLQIL